MTDLEEQVMQLTNDLYVLKHTVIAWKTVEERIRESNTVPEDAMTYLEWAKVYWPQDYEVVDEMKTLKEENRKLKEEIEKWKATVKDLNGYNKFRIAENEKLREEISKENMDTWFDEKANNIFIDKNWKVIKGWEFMTLC